MKVKTEFGYVLLTSPEMGDKYCFFVSGLQPEAREDIWGGTRNHIIQNETQEQLEPWTISHSWTQKRSSSNWGGYARKKLNQLFNRSEPH
jgi:hypothetical protein